MTLNGEITEYGLAVIREHFDGDVDRLLEYLLKAQVLDQNKLRIAVIKHFYRNECKKTGKMQAQTNTAEEFGLTERTVQNILYHPFYERIGF